MALSNIEQVRLYIADRPRQVLSEVLGIGTAIQVVDFKTRFRAVAVGSDSLSTRAAGVLTPLTRDVDYTIAEATGLVTLAVALANGAELLATYTWSVFSDDELTDLLALHGDEVLATAITCLRMTLADIDRFIRYTLGQEIVDRDGARKALTDLLKNLEDLAAASGNLSLVMALPDTFEEYTLRPFLGQIAEEDWV